MKTLPLALLLSLASTAASANNELAVRASSLYAIDSGLFTTGGSNAVLQAEIGYARALRPIWRGQLWAELSWLGGERHADALGFHSSLIVQQFTVGARYTLPLRPWLVPHLRLGAGPLFANYRLRDNTIGDASSWSGAFTAQALAGLTLLFPRPWMSQALSTGFTVGLVLEGGVAYSTDLTFALSPTPPSDLSSPSSGPTLGSLSLIGPLFRLGAVARF